MAYEFDEIYLLKDEGKDWWETIKRVPLKVLDQDFGKEVLFSDLEEPKKVEVEAEAEGSPSEDSAVVFDLDNLQRKPEVIQNSGYSKVNFGDKYFETEIFSNHFDKKDFSARVEKGFLIISGCCKGKVEGDGTLWRKFERRYMLPRNYNITNLHEQLLVKEIEGGINAKVYRIPEKGLNPSPKKSPKRKGDAAEEEKASSRKLN